MSSNEKPLLPRLTHLTLSSYRGSFNVSLFVEVIQSHLKASELSADVLSIRSVHLIVEQRILNNVIRAFKQVRSRGLFLSGRDKIGDLEIREGAISDEIKDSSFS